jgi:hypothetical protein
MDHAADEEQPAGNNHGGEMKYRVTREIDLDATSPRAAAREALRIQRDPESIATVFSVRETKSDIPLDDEVIDLSKSRKRRKR